MSVAGILAARGIVAQERPEHAPGCYVMYFYCKYDNPEHPYQSANPGRYMEEADQVETRTEAIRQMRKYGWGYYGADGTATCPRCAKAIQEARLANAAQGGR